ncbi:D-alanyl-D-alanine carboxypeptidase family protein [Hydrogenovibrio kuenenii]|uniref:D-alanyl-D-alanine carboxypeptidase family protein n=1 Tax=Hydrogenovibrio kuenenii TaxID=63658 RepID=UPI000466E7A8|nr:D-alanyl-D-alanine carboxypeptidase family protein [Hydrogenovibrio kuenenii]
MTKLFSIFIALFLVTTNAWSDTPVPQPGTSVSPPMPYVIPSPPKLDAKAYLVVDFNSGAVLADFNANQRIEPASLTKIMSGYVILSELKNGNMSLNDMVTISPKAWKMPGSKMFIEVGQKVSVSNLIKGMVVQSGNDATVALAEHVAGSEGTFVEMMNKYAQVLGMTGTHFANATGLPNPDHYSTAVDLAKVAKALIQKFPDDYKWYDQKKFTFNGITQYNRNKLLWQDPSVDGLKTGHTESAGYCLVSSAHRNGMRIVTVVVGTPSAAKRVSESQKLINYAFRFFETHKLYTADQRLHDARVWEGKQNTVGLSLAKDLYITIPRGQYKNLKIETTIKSDIRAPITKGQQLGDLHVSLNGKVIAERPLVATSEVEEGSFFKKIIDQIKLLFQSLLNFIGL